MIQKVLLATPPFTQLNTPYPATAYLKGFLNTKEIDCFQSDLGIEVILELFCSEGLQEMFDEVEPDESWSSQASRIYHLREKYIRTIDPLILFLQRKNPTLAHLICERKFLPEGERFAQLEDMDWLFGTMGVQDKARHLATLYLEDISDFIVEAIDPHFGFSRYAERLGRSANKFDELYEELTEGYSYIDSIALGLLGQHIEREQPDLVAFSVPFPGNLYSALRCGQWIRAEFPEIKVAMGGGFPNTELRSLTDARVFEFVDFITLDDGEAPVEILIDFLNGQRTSEQLKRTFLLEDGEVVFRDGAQETDYAQKDVGTPDYSDFYLDHYLSVIEIANPMHRLWSDGRWNKLTMAHGCYWGKCTFCDVSLDYIRRYEPLAAKLLCDRMEEMIEQTGQNGFHFVDEAAPPALMKEVALEILRRKMTVVWWTNIRFEKSFTADLCRLLSASGCIAISGGLEVASDRLLELIKKGVTVAQVAKVADNLTKAGIKVHAYLMYGFPTQSTQETIDSMETVRQMFESGIVQSGFWHRFAMTAHSPVGLDAAAFGVEKVTEEIGSFANNDIEYLDQKGAVHELFGEGLKVSLYNYMNGAGFDVPLNEWFEFGIPKTKIKPGYIANILKEGEETERPMARVIWLGETPLVEEYTRKKKGKETAMYKLRFFLQNKTLDIQIQQRFGAWLIEWMDKLVIGEQAVKLKDLEADFTEKELGDFAIFWNGFNMKAMRDEALLVV